MLICRGSWAIFLRLIVLGSIVGGLFSHLIDFFVPKRFCTLSLALRFCLNPASHKPTKPINLRTKITPKRLAPKHFLDDFATLHYVDFLTKFPRKPRAMRDKKHG